MAGTALFSTQRLQLPSATFKATRRSRALPHKLCVAYFEVRPYTIRKGDTVTSIATKREFKVDDIVALNIDVDLDNLAEGKTILIPAGKLSSRDKEILNGIGTNSYRLYPVRKGESVEDIMSKRGILLSELEELNPGVNLKKLKEHQVLKLPGNKFTTREKEMLVANKLVPFEFFSNSKAYGFGLGTGLIVAAVVALWQRSQRPDASYDE